MTREYPRTKDRVAPGNQLHGGPRSVGGLPTFSCRWFQGVLIVRQHGGWFNVNPNMMLHAMKAILLTNSEKRGFQVIF